ncbi:Putative AC9 transposase [Frankliniella fusca]|uniref:AC9 transposase n=1 Tax=Frankliniella fusca TaxID=407009 RepID=A0AAE1LMA3_9NEOP|nr:Putative AC9 transposase [Frankliniella fusca]
MLSEFVKGYKEVKKMLEKRKEGFLLEGVDVEKVRDLANILKPFDALMTKHKEVELRGTLWLEFEALLKQNIDDSPLVADLKEQWRDQLKPLYYSFVHQQCKSLVHEEIRSKYLQQPDVQAPSPPKRAKVAECYQKYMEDDDDALEMEEDEVDRYLREPITNDEDLIAWWRQRRERFPRLSALAEHLLCIPATSASAEREFSEAGHVFREKRLRLAPNTASHILFLNSNFDFVADAGKNERPDQ